MDFLEKNDIDTTHYVVSSLKVTTLFGVMIWFLNIIGVFTIQQSIMNTTMCTGLCIMLIPIFALKKFNVSAQTLKYMSITCLVLGITIMNCGMTYQSLLSWSVPILIASHYYSPKITKIMFVSTAILMFIAMYIGLFWGTWDSNMMASTDVVYGFQNRLEFLKLSAANGRNTIVYIIYIYYLPRLIIMFGFYFLDVSLSKRTHNLLLMQEKEYLEKENRNQELSVATHIQNSALPNVFPAFPDRSEFEIYASMDPSKEVGGDFYDFFLIDHDHLALIIADVSGKGVPGAMFMMATKIMIKNSTYPNASPAKVLMDVNNQLCENDDSGMFVTVWFGIYEISTGKITASNAGHEYPLFKAKDRPFEVIKDTHGLVIGAMEDIVYEDYEMQLEQGDILYVYTDGVLDALNSASDEYGMERLISNLNEKAYKSLEEMLSIVKKDVDTFADGEDQFDDITMLTIRRN
ncbi:MAG: PP2C family protein-serine/threonine phosphatase [Eubacteriales bacterium]